MPIWRLQNGGIRPNKVHTFGYIIGAYKGVPPCNASVRIVDHTCDGENKYIPCQYPGFCGSVEPVVPEEPEESMFHYYYYDFYSQIVILMENN